jgi:hypothetical protein
LRKLAKSPCFYKKLNSYHKTCQAIGFTVPSCDSAIKNVLMWTQTTQTKDLDSKLRPLTRFQTILSQSELCTYNIFLPWSCRQ